MSAFYLDRVAINPKREEIRSEPVRVRVDAIAHRLLGTFTIVAGAEA
jgi:hypothetical protein